MAIALREQRAVRDVEIVIERPDGSRQSVLPYPTPLYDGAGNMTGAVNVLVDITERKKAESGLAARSALVEAMADNMSVGLFMLNAEGEIDFMNAAAERITGYSFDDLRGRLLHTAMHRLRPDGSDFPAQECPIYQASRASRRLGNHEDVFTRPDGTQYDVQVNMSPIEHEGRRLGSILDVRDATKEKAAERALRASEENLRAAAVIKDQFLGLVSHELRTPISTILGNGLLLLRRGDRLQAEDREQALTDVVTEANKLKEIIENLLLLTRLESGKVEGEPLALARIVEESVADFKRQQPEREVRLTLSPEIPPALGQQTLVSLVLRNLLSNAAKYSPPEMPIEVEVHRTATGDPEVVVRDRGIGMADDDRREVFEPFFRAKQATLKAKGMGLGLAVCKRVIDAHDGSISASAEPGRGSEFRFSLHRVEAPDPD